MKSSRGSRVPRQVTRSTRSQNPAMWFAQARIPPANCSSLRKRVVTSSSLGDFPSDCT